MKKIEYIDPKTEVAELKREVAELKQYVTKETAKSDKKIQNITQKLLNLTDHGAKIYVSTHYSFCPPNLLTCRDAIDFTYAYKKLIASVGIFVSTSKDVGMYDELTATSYSILYMLMDMLMDMRPRNPEKTEICNELTKIWFRTKNNKSEPNVTHLDNVADCAVKLFAVDSSTTEEISFIYNVDALYDKLYKFIPGYHYRLSDNDGEYIDEDVYYGLTIDGGFLMQPGVTTQHVRRSYDNHGNRNEHLIKK